MRTQTENVLFFSLYLCLLSSKYMIVPLPPVRPLCWLAQKYLSPGVKVFADMFIFSFSQ